MQGWIPGGAVFSDRVEHGQQLAHAGHQGDLLALACRQQVLVMGFEHRVVTYSHQRCHVQGTAYFGAPTPRGDWGSGGPPPPGPPPGRRSSEPSSGNWANSTATLVAPTPGTLASTWARSA